MSFIIPLYLLPLCCIQIALTQNKEEVLLHVHIGQWEAKYIVCTEAHQLN